METDKVLHSGMSLFPDLNIRASDLQHPTESFLTKLFVHYLKAFGFRIEPPFNVDSASNDQSKMKRIFLAKLCRQVEEILQFSSLYGRPYTYADIVAPSAKKTKTALEFLFNYMAYYKLYKKDVLAPVEEKIKQRESLMAEIEEKRSILEQRKDNATSLVTDIEQAQQNIQKLRNELPKSEEEFQRQKKLCKEQKEYLYLQEKRHEDLMAKVKDWEQKVVKDSQVEEIQREIETTERSIESYKKEIAMKSQEYQTQSEEMALNEQMVKELNELMEILPPAVLNEYNEHVKQKERLKKELLVLENQNKKSHGNFSDAQQQWQELQNEHKRRRNLHENQQKQGLHQIDVAKSENDDLKALVQQMEEQLGNIQVKIDEEEDTGNLIQDNVKRVLGQYWQSK